MVQKKYTPEEALQRVKLMMKYDSSTTLTENKSKIGILSEQSTFSKVSSVAKKINNIMSGDVETSDLEDLLNLLNSEVFGKKMEDGTCMMSKVVQYYGKSGDIFGGAGGGFLGTGDLLKDIAKSTEFGEPEFEDVKQELLGKINKEMTSCGGKRTEDGDKVVTASGKSKYKSCSGTYSEGCEASAVGKVQSCLGGLTVDNKFGPKTASKLIEKGFKSTFTDSDVEKICKGKENKPEISGEVDQINVADL